MTIFPVLFAISRLICENPILVQFSSPETYLFTNSPQIFMIMMFNVFVGVLISYLFNFVEKKLNYFTESPFEKILLLVRIEVQKIVIQNIIPSFLARKK